MARSVIISRGLLGLCLFILIGCAGPSRTPEPEITDVQLKKAYALMKQDKFEEAISIYAHYLEKQPESLDARSGLGLGYLKTGRLDGAIKEFKAVLAVNPEHPQAILYLGMAHLKQNRFREAIKVWRSYKAKRLPLVQKEIKRQMTLLLMKLNQRSAEKAMQKEKQLQEAGVVAKIDPKVLAVCYYQDVSPDKSMRAFQKGLAAMMITTLSKIKSIRVVERLRLQALLEEMALGMTGIVDEKTAPRVGKLVGAGRMVTGSLSVGSIEVTTNLTLTGSGVLEGSQSVSVERENFFDLPGQIVTNVAEIGQIELSPQEKQAIGVPLTTSVDAVIALGAGLEALDAGNFLEAQQQFQAALSIDPTFQLAVDASQAVPPPEAPTPQQLKKMTSTQVSNTVESPINAALTSHQELDAEVVIRTLIPIETVTPFIIQEQDAANQIERIVEQVEKITEELIEEETATTAVSELPSFPSTPE